MNLSTETFRFTFLTPCFSGTAEGKDAVFSEFRVPPIRGHIRFWHREAFGADSANRVWGSTTGSDGQGSHIALRSTVEPQPSRQAAQLLPHKTHGQGNRPALPQGAAASIQLQRLPACTNDDWARAATATRLWLVAGTLGYRASRGAGSVWPEADWSPQSRSDLAALLAPLLRRAANPWAAALIGEAAGAEPQLLRQAASNTVSRPTDVFGSAQPRTPSAVRFKVIQLGGRHCLLALAPSVSILRRAQEEIARKQDRRFWSDLGQWQPL